MEDLFQKQRHIYTVSELTQDIKLLLENTFAQVWVEGEVSGVRKIPTGTTFFNLKDEQSILKCVIFASGLEEIKFELKDGIKIVSFGRVGLYEKRGDYQLYVERIEPKGLGSLQLALEQLKIKLEKEGLFSQEHKRPIPYLAGKIGVVTSSSGAAIKDVLKVLDRRFSDCEVVIRPAQVQGEGAKEDIARGIQELNRFNEELTAGEKIEVLIVGRGGGSIEDLWAFNEEIVARAIYASKIPVISAVGHERDWTIADLVSDLRAATPSVAAELVAPKKEDLQQQLAGFKADLKRSLVSLAESLQENLDDLSYRVKLSAEHIFSFNATHLEATLRKLKLLNPVLLIDQHREKISDLARQIMVRAGHFLRLKEAEFHTAAGKLSSLSPLNILSRGYSIAFKMPQGAVVKDARSLKSGDTLKLRLHKGEVISEVKGVSENGGN